MTEAPFRAENGHFARRKGLVIKKDVNKIDGASEWAKKALAAVVKTMPHPAPPEVREAMKAVAAAHDQLQDAIAAYRDLVAGDE